VLRNRQSSIVNRQSSNRQSSIVNRQSTMHTISFVTANYVARQMNYAMTSDWGPPSQATSDYFQPLETFAARFGELLADISALGFVGVDLWLAHLSPAWATPEHIAIARRLLAEHGLHLTSLAGWFGMEREEFTAVCAIAAALSAPVLAGGAPILARERGFVVETLQRYGLKLALENHPEKHPAELLAQIGDGGGGSIGAAVDTGWFGTQGYPADQALRELRDQLFAVHLKDVLAPGAHHTCRYGLGVVPLRACVQVLREVGYSGVISVEHEPEQGDPTEDVRASYAMLREWLAEGR
jgi:sugar phosphate isomerase/epimerase